MAARWNTLGLGGMTNRHEDVSQGRRIEQTVLPAPMSEISSRILSRILASLPRLGCLAPEVWTAYVIWPWAAWVDPAPRTGEKQI